MLNRPVAVVTGAYRGLGLETCRQLAAKDHNVVLTARREREGRAAADGLQKEGSTSASIGWTSRTRNPSSSSPPSSAIRSADLTR